MMRSLILKNPLINSLLLLAVLISSSIFIMSKQHKSAEIKASSNQPDSFMENVTATIMNKDGLPKLKIEAPKMVHYAENNQSYFTKPHVTIYRQSPQPWYIDSDFGKALNGIEHIIFSSHVVIHHLADAAEPGTSMQTTSLDVFPNQKQATTQEAVTITQPDTVVHAIGMLANLEDGTVKLLSEAKGEYVPSS